MQDTQKDFLLLLGYFYLNQKADKALVIYRVLHDHFPEDIYVIKALCYACIANGVFESGLRLANRFIKQARDGDERHLGYLLKGKSLWGLGRKDEARQALARYFVREEEVHHEAEPR